MAGEAFSPGIIALHTPNGAVRQVADGVASPNGMAVTPDNATVILAESYARRLTAFAIAADGNLSNRRVLEPTSATAAPTASASTRKALSGTPTSPINAACACAKAAKYCRQSRSTAAASPACSAGRTGGRCSSPPRIGAGQRQCLTGRERASC